MALDRTVVPLPRQSRECRFLLDTWNAEQRTIEVVWTTGARVMRRDWDTGEIYAEELSLDPAHVRLGRLNAGAPVLDGHRRWDSRAVIGRVERAWLAGAEGRATLRFTQQPDAEPVIGRIREGILLATSAGYRTHKIRQSREESGLLVRLAIDWEPDEISFVPIGADPGAGARSETETFPCIVEGRVAPKEKTMSAPAQATAADTPPVNPPSEIALSGSAAGTRAADDPPAPASAPSLEAAVQAALAAERTRAAAIRARVRAAGVDDAVADDLVARGVAVEHAGNHILDEIARRSGAGTFPAIAATGRPSGDDPAVIRERMVDAFVARATETLPAARAGAPAGAGRFVAPEASRQYMGLGLLHGLAEYARLRGARIPNNLDRTQLYEALVAERALSVSDFPFLLANTANKALMAVYQLATPTYRAIAARRSFADFKPHAFLKVGDFPMLLEKGENGEYKYGSISEARSLVTLAEYGRIVPIGRRVLINDDLSALSDLVGAIGRRIPDFENGLVWALLQSAAGAGPNLTEPFNGEDRTAALFSTAAAGWDTLAAVNAAIGIGPVGIARAAMMKKRSLDGLKLNIAPRILVTGPDQMTVAEQFVSVNLAASQFSNINPFAGALVALGDANISSATAWYLFADPSVAPTVIYGHLGQQAGPRIEADSPFTSDGIRVKAALDFGYGAIDYRGAYRNAGA